MPNHILQQIREAMYQHLDTSLGVTTVYKGRRSTIKQASLPAVNIASIDELLDHTQIDDGLVVRAGTLVIEVSSKSVDDCEPELFDIQRQIEESILLNPTLGGLVHYLELKSSRQEELEVAEAEYLIERRILNFEFQTATGVGTPTVVIQ